MPHSSVFHEWQAFQSIFSKATSQENSSKASECPHYNHDLEDLAGGSGDEKAGPPTTHLPFAKTRYWGRRGSGTHPKNLQRLSLGKGRLHPSPSQNFQYSQSFVLKFLKLETMREISIYTWALNMCYACSKNYKALPFKSPGKPMEKFWLGCPSHKWEIWGCEAHNMPWWQESQDRRQELWVTMLKI